MNEQYINRKLLIIIPRQENVAHEGIQVSTNFKYVNKTIINVK